MLAHKKRGEDFWFCLRFISPCDLFFYLILLCVFREDFSRTKFRRLDIRVAMATDFTTISCFSSSKSKEKNNDFGKNSAFLQRSFAYFRMSFAVWHLFHLVRFFVAFVDIANRNQKRIWIQILIPLQRQSSARSQTNDNKLIMANEFRTIVIIDFWLYIYWMKSRQNGFLSIPYGQQSILNDLSRKKRQRLKSNDNLLWFWTHIDMKTPFIKQIKQFGHKIWDKHRHKC